MSRQVVSQLFFSFTAIAGVRQAKLVKASYPFFTRLENKGAPETNTGGRNTPHRREESVSVGDLPSDKEVEEDDGSFSEDDDENEMFEESERSSGTPLVNGGTDCES